MAAVRIEDGSDWDLPCRGGHCGPAIAYPTWAASSGVKVGRNNNPNSPAGKIWVMADLQRLRQSAKEIRRT